jgi:hypothetical protein
MSKISEVLERLAALEATIATIGHNGGPPLDEESKPVLIADRRVADRYDVSVRTLARWDELPELGFPPPIYIRDRRYRELAKLEQWDRHNARKAAPPKAARDPRLRKPAAADSGEATLK